MNLIFSQVCFAEKKNIKNQPSILFACIRTLKQKERKQIYNICFPRAQKIHLKLQHLWALDNNPSGDM